MNPEKLKTLLEAVAGGEVQPNEALDRMRGMPFEDIGFAKVDHHRPLRSGIPETIYCAGKTPAQIVAIVSRMIDHGANVLGTRCSAEAAAQVAKTHEDAVYDEAARTITVTVEPPEALPGFVAIVCAGTSDLPVAEEAAITCEAMGAPVERIYDVGVAGIHRLLAQREHLAKATAIVVCAGMEGALPSAVGGLVDVPVIAVPTSIGYGASFGGIAALLGMLNSCASGVSVVNIDNGYGAGVCATMILRLAAGGSNKDEVDHQ
jgi:NCAIR mutase (PurE)-related protein